jgi:hypothetical protein
VTKDKLEAMGLVTAPEPEITASAFTAMTPQGRTGQQSPTRAQVCIAGLRSLAGDMGLYLHSLGEIPTGSERAYYLYLLDYGWEEPLGDAVRANIPRMADLASRSDAVLIHGPRGVHFEDEVLSWHRVNGQDAKDILAAILVTARHPSTFRESFERKRSRKGSKDALFLIPLRRVCQSAEDVEGPSSHSLISVTVSTWRTERIASWRLA